MGGFEVSSSDVGSLGGILGFFTTIGLISNIISVAITIFQLVCTWRIFTKMGIEGWKSLIPIYNAYVFARAIWGGGWKFLLTLIPIVGIYFAIKWNIDLAKCFGESTGFGIGLIFLSPIFMAILAFGNATYQGNRQ